MIILPSEITSINSGFVFYLNKRRDFFFGALIQNQRERERERYFGTQKERKKAFKNAKKAKLITSIIAVRLISPNAKCSNGFFFRSSSLFICIRSVSWSIASVCHCVLTDIFSIIFRSNTNRSFPYVAQHRPLYSSTIWNEKETNE